VPWLSRLLAGLSLWSPEFNLTSVHVSFVVDVVSLGQVFLWICRFSPVSTIPLMLHTHLYLNVALIRRMNGRSLESFQNTILFRKSGSIGYKYLRFLLLEVLGTKGMWLCLKHCLLKSRDVDSSTIAHIFKTTNNINYFDAKSLFPSMQLSHVCGFKNVLSFFWDMKPCIPAEDCLDGSESGGSTLLRNVRTYIALYLSKRKASIPPLWKSRFSHCFTNFITASPFAFSCSVESSMT
jgi:hypothetical protein